jgi:phage/plasmid primase-like uncharacterized protein
MSEDIPPQNIEAEQHVLGAVMLNDRSNRVNEKNVLMRDIIQALTDRFEEFVEYLLDEPKTRTRKEWRYGKKGSLSISMDGPKRGSWFDFEADKSGGPLQLIQHSQGLSLKDAIEWAKNFIGPGYTSPSVPRKASPTKKSEEQERLEKLSKAQRIVDESDPVFETPGDYYLRRRGITASLPDCIRYRMNAWGKYGSLVAVATDSKGNVQAVQEIYVDDDQKAPLDIPKRTNGALVGAAVKCPPTTTGGPIILAEGIETGISVLQATGYETWIFFGVGNVGKCEFPPGRPIIIARDSDEPGSRADTTIRKAIRSLLEKGMDVSVATPPEGQDFNDVLIRDGGDAVRIAIEAAEPQEGIKPYFDSDPLSVEEAQVSLACLTNMWFDEAIANPDMTIQRALKAAAGLGKTEEYIKALTQRDDIRSLVVEVYVPTHALADELIERLRSQDPDLKVRPIRGRGYEAGTPLAVCRKADVATAIGRLGLPVQSTLCLNKDGSETCEYYDDCPYQRQFQDNGPEVRILVHEYLTINRIKGAPGPDLTIIDETFWQSALDKTSFGIDRLNIQGRSQDYIKILARRVQSAMENGEPVKKALKDNGVTDSELRDAARAARADLEAISISPGLDIDTQRRLISKANPSEGLKLCRMWRLMAEEFDQPGDEFVRVQFKRDFLHDGERQNRIFLYWRKDFRIKEGHVLVLDADANEEILKPFLPEIKVITIDVERNAEVIQVVDTPCSNWKLLADKPDAAAQLAAQSLGNVQAFINQKPNLVTLNLVVATKKIAKCLKAPEGCDVVWFGSFLGVDIWKDFDTVNIVGREQAPPVAYEEQARALWWDQGLKLIEPDELGNRFLSKETRAYRMRDGSIRTVEVDVHPDPRIQMLVEQGREAQSAQAIDRLRLIHNKLPKRVYILSNIPLDVTVDKLVTWREMVASPVQRALSRHGVLPTSPSELARIFPDIWPTSAAAKEQLKRQKLNRNDSLIRYLLENRSYLILVKYRRPGQRGKSTKALISFAIPDPRAALEAVVGEVIHFEYVKFCHQKGDIPVHVAEGEIRDPLESSVFGGLGSCQVDMIRSLPDDSGFDPVSSSNGGVLVS